VPLSVGFQFWERQPPISSGLLKKVQMPGGARGEVRGVLGPYVAAPRERLGVPVRRMGPRRWAFFSSLSRARLQRCLKLVQRVKGREHGVADILEQHKPDLTVLNLLVVSHESQDLRPIDQKTRGQAERLE
jgi:hypothetical protein